VTVLEYLPGILGSLDKEIIKRAVLYLKKQKISIQTGTMVQRIDKEGDTLLVVTQGKKNNGSYEADAVLLATGRRPFTGGLGLDKLGVDTERGAIITDENYETNVPGIYAIGDVIKGPMLTHVASEEGIVAVERMNGATRSINYDAIPACIFSFPEVASVGLSQEQAQERQIDVKVGRSIFAANGKALTMGETDGLVKVIAKADDTVIGVQIIGPHASDLILEASVIVTNKLKLQDVIETIHPHPTLGEVLLEAFKDTAGRSVHTVSKK